MNPDVTNDEFLMRMQPEVRPAFAEALAGRLRRQAHRRQRRVGALLAVALMVSSLMLLPTVRAAVQDLVWEIGGILFIECGTHKSCIETSQDMLRARAYDPDAEVKTGVYRIETVIDDLPFSLQLMEDVLGRYVYDNLVHVTREGERFSAEMNWYAKDCSAETCAPAMALTIVNDPEAMPALVPDGATTEGTGHTVYRHPRGESGIIWCAEEFTYYSRGQTLCYRLSWADPELTMSRGLMMYGIDRLVPAERYGDTPMIPFEALRAVYPDVVDFLPTWVPEGFNVAPADLIAGRYSVTVAMIWRAESQSPGGADDGAWISMSVLDLADDFAWPVTEGSLQETKVDGHPAALIQRSLPHTNDVYTLMWRQYGFQYSLSWSARHVATEDIIRMAASVPEDGKLPLPPEQIDDLLRLMIAEGLFSDYESGHGPSSLSNDD
jgi:hypothetical protein